MITVGLVAVDVDRKWIGGRYYLQHQVRAVSTLPEGERVRLVDASWMNPPADDPFAEVRTLLDGQVVITPPSSLHGRAVRKIRNILRSRADAGDLFANAGVDVLFPIAPCDNAGIPLVFWMPDFQPWRMPELFTAEMREWYFNHYRTNGEIAARIALSSEDGRRDLETYFPEFAEKARVLRFCSAPSADWTAADPVEAAAKYNLPEKFFVLSNQFSDHKNHLIVFEAVRILREEGLHVTLACTGSTFGFRGGQYFQAVTEFLEENDLSNSIRILGLIDRADQVALMRRSIGMLQPSKFEGWSTVIEDAKTLGKSLLASDISVHREQAPPRARYLPVDQPEAWAHAMRQLWASGTPGPDESAEREGHRVVQGRMSEAGRAFVAVMREAARR
jgi:glycosyltransferase involved in cell wall biosynthesis